MDSGNTLWFKKSWSSTVVEIARRWPPHCCISLIQVLTAILVITLMLEEGEGGVV